MFSIKIRNISEEKVLSIKQNANLFFVGIGGTGMSALATIMLDQGYKIAGSDRSRSSITETLEQSGASIFYSHSESNISAKIDYVVYSNAICESNPELLKAKDLNIPIIVRAELLNFIGSHFFSIGISGTHGKTTTTSMISRIFLSSGLDPTLAVGGYLPEISGAGHFGKGDIMIYEACEAYDSINHFHPDIAVITNIDEDHLDFFKNREEVEAAFLRYINNNLKPNSLVIWNADDKPLSDVIEKSHINRRISTSIYAGQGDFWVENITLHSNSSEFDVFFDHEFIGHFNLGIPGFHNVSNALLAIATCKIGGKIDNTSIVKALTNFQNANRRFELKNETHSIMVIDDYAHHPTAIMLTLEAAKKIAIERNAKLIVIFQPHLYSRTQYFYKEFSRSLLLADSVILTDIYAARENNEHNISSQLIYDEIVKLKTMDHLILEEELNKIPLLIKNIISDQHAVVITLGAGDVWKVSEQICC